MTKRLSSKVYARLKTPYISRHEIEVFFCNFLKRKKQCPKQRGGTCEECYPVLQELVNEDLENARKPKGLIRWRLKQYGLGNLQTSAKKTPPRIYHRTIDPFEDPKLLERKILQA